MKMDSVKLASLSILIVFCIGCGPINSVFSGVKHFFFPKKIDLQKQANVSEAEKNLANLFAVGEEKLHFMLRKLNTFEKNDPQMEADYFYQEFEWVEWVAVTDLQGGVEDRYPSTAKQQIGIKDLQKSVQKKFPRKMQFKLAPDGSGSDICVFKPLHKDYSLDGYIVVGVDFDSLLQYNSDPEKLVVLTPERVLWSGKYKGLNTEIIQQDWERKLKNKVKGKIKIHDQKFFWFARYIGVDPIVYVLKNP